VLRLCQLLEAITGGTEGIVVTCPEIPADSTGTLDKSGGDRRLDVALECIESVNVISELAEGCRRRFIRRFVQPGAEVTTVGIDGVGGGRPPSRPKIARHLCGGQFAGRGGLSWLTVDLVGVG